MSKLLAVPITVLTVALAVAFISPATATGAVRAVSPGIHAGLLVVAPAAFSNSNSGSWARLDNTSAISGTSGSARTRVSSAGNTPTLSGTQQSSALPGTSGISDRALGDGHDVATAGRMNCGRFGNGFHGGKHNFTCPNRPFPGQPAS
ncbi:MAG TPA: hypothetical protein VIT43_06945 [Candidatus Dormibacteraeota bacterium]